MYFLFCKGSTSNNIILTNKRITGDLKFAGQTTQIDIPLDKIESITTETNFLKIGIVQIKSGTTIRGASYVLNGEDFCKKTRDEIEKYKKYMYDKKN